MRLLGLEIRRGGTFGVTISRALPALRSPADSGRWTTIFDFRPGAWQSDASAASTDQVQSFAALYSCLALISSDVGKLGLGLMRRKGRIWIPTESPAFSPVLRKPNGYQTRQQFIASWVLMLLQTGNTKSLKERDARGIVTGLHVLDTTKAETLISTSGEVFYRLSTEELAGIDGEQIIVPASEIIHDRINCLFHPMVGTSPLMACGLAASQGLAIQASSARFFRNGAQPGGVLSAPGSIDEAAAARVKKHWEEKFSGDNAGRVAVLGNGLKYEPLSMKPVDAELVAQLRLSAEMVCTAFRVPGYKVGVGTTPTYQNAEVLNQIYYTDCLQTIIEGIEACLDEGLGVAPAPASDGQLRVEFDVDDLLRMDSATKMKVASDGVKAAILSPDEGRQKFNLEPVTGGGTPYLQQQNFSLAALAKRDADDPFAKPAPAPAAAPAPDDGEDESAAMSEEVERQTQRLLVARMAARIATHEVEWAR